MTLPPMYVLNFLIYEENFVFLFFREYVKKLKLEPDVAVQTKFPGLLEK